MPILWSLGQTGTLKSQRGGFLWRRLLLDRRPRRKLCRDPVALNPEFVAYRPETAQSTVQFESPGFQSVYGGSLLENTGISSVRSPLIRCIFLSIGKERLMLEKLLVAVKS